MSEFKEICKKYKLYAKKEKVNNIYILHYLYTKLKFDVSIDDYFKHKLYKRDVSHKEFYESTWKYCRSFNQSQQRFMPNAGKAWIFIHYLDFFVSKFVYPGLDGMDYFMYEFYNIRDNKRKTFITGGSLIKMVTHFNGKSSSSKKLLMDKGQFNAHFPDIITRKWIVSENLSFEKFNEFCSGLDKVIIKPIDGQGGKEIFFYQLENRESIKKLYDIIMEDRYIIEEIIEQHPDLGKINPSSVNTVRVYSVRSNDEVYITGAVLRMGRKDSVTDNYSSGGLAAEIDVELGIVTSRAVSHNNDSVYIHPDSSIILIGYKIPFWSEIKEKVKSAHLRIPNLRYIAWDVAVTSDNNITFIEANSVGAVDLQQHPCLIGKKPIYEQYY